MTTTPQPTRPGWKHRLQAILALLGGEPMPQVTARFGICRSVLYKWRHRALCALQRIFPPDFGERRTISRGYLNSCSIM